MVVIVDIEDALVKELRDACESGYLPDFHVDGVVSHGGENRMAIVDPIGEYFSDNATIGEALVEAATRYFFLYRECKDVVDGKTTDVLTRVDLGDLLNDEPDGSCQYCGNHTNECEIF